MSLVTRFRGNIVIVKGLRGAAWNALAAIRSRGKWVILAAILVHATAWIALCNVTLSFTSQDFVFGQPVSKLFAQYVALTSLLVIGSSALTFLVLIPFVISD